MDEEEWRARLVKTVAHQVRRYRLERGLSVQKLADICTEEYGLPIKRSVLANFEGGRRPALSLVELLVLARILKVPPILLVFPVGLEDTSEILPGESVNTWAALKWFIGEADRLPGDMEATDTETVRLYREHDRRVNEWWDSREKMLNLLDSSDPELVKLRSETDSGGRGAPLVELFRQSTQSAEDAIRTVRQTMRDRGLMPPDLGPWGAAIEGVTLEDQVQIIAETHKLSLDEARQKLYRRTGIKTPVEPEGDTE